MPRLPKDVSIRWAWAWDKATHARRYHLLLGLSASVHRTPIAIDEYAVDLVSIWLHLLLGRVQVTIQMRSLPIHDWRPGGGSNA